MSLFVTARGAAQYPGVFPVEVAQPIVIDGIAQGYVGLAMRSEWGPDTAANIPLSSGDMLQTYFPAGCSRTSSGYYATMKRKRVPWCLARVLHSDAAASSLTVAGTGGNWQAAGKYKGVLGNSITFVQAASSDGNTAHRKFTVSLTGTTGTTQEIYDNVAFGDVVDVSKSYLLASFSVDNAMTVWPANASHPMVSGSDGSAATGADYTAAIALFQVQDAIRVVAADDCGDSLRAVTNAALQAHCDLLTDRICVLMTSKANAWSAVQSDVTSYVDDRVCFTGLWVNVKDDNGVNQVSPTSTFIASALINLEPQQSHAWWDDQVTDYYTGIDSLYAQGFSSADPTVAAQATLAGICLPVKLPSGRFAMMHDRTTSASANKRFMVTRRIKDYEAKSIKNATTAFVNGPNILGQQQLFAQALVDFLERETVKGRFSSVPQVDFKSPNSPSSIALGEFAVAINGTTPSVMEKIYLLMNVGPTVTVTVQ